jgi:hypothetical protein
MNTDSLEACIRQLECQVFHPSRYAATVVGSAVNTTAAREGYARMVAELEGLYSMRQRQAVEKWRERAPIGGQRHSTGPLERPKPQEPGPDTYDPYDEDSQWWRQR